MSGKVHKLTLYPGPDHFGRCYAAVSEMARELGFDPDEEFRFAVCVSEAYTNAFIHGNKSNLSKSINVVFAWDEETVRVDVEDQGEAKSEALHLDGARELADPLGDLRLDRGDGYRHGEAALERAGLRFDCLLHVIFL